LSQALRNLVDSAAPAIHVAGMKSHEAEPVSALFREVLAALPYYNGRAKEAEAARYSAERLADSIVADPDSVMVATMDSCLVGFCFSSKDSELIWLSWFGVRPGQRGKGIGSALLNSLERRAISSGSHKVWCDCRTDNTASKAILIGHDYQPLCTVQNHWHGQDYILWQKFIA
jgi:GNAT superfamily N-acetyltransferase